MEIRVLFFLVLVDKISKADASCKTMKFNKDFPGKSLKNFVFKRIQAKESFCTNLCYMHDGCLSVNYATEEQTCELSESDHRINPEYWEDTPGYVYYSAENTCKCPKHKICRHNFILNTFKCECNSKYPGANCTITPSPSSTDTASSLASFSSLVSSSPSLSSVSSVPSSLLSDTSSPSLSLPASPSSSVSLSSVVSASPSVSSVFSSSMQTPTLTYEFLSPSTSVSSLSLSPSPSSMVSSSEYPSSAPESPSLSTSVLSSISPSLSSLSCASASLSHSSGCQLNYPRASQDDYIEAFPNFPQDLEEITLSFWLKVPSSFSNTLGIFSYQSGVYYMSVLMQDTSQVEFTLNGGQKILKSDFVRDDTWQHIAITLKDNGHLKLYTNGKKTADENNMSAGYIKKNNDGKIRLGKIDGKTDFIQGSIAELYIWKVDLSGADVETVFDFKCGPIGKFKEKELISSWDAIVNSACYHGEVNKSCPTTCPGFTGVCQLDYPSGSQDDYVEALPNFSQDFEELTLSFWLKVPSSYTNNLAIVSYRTQDESSDMSVVIKDTSEVEFKINGGGKTLKSNFVRDNTWQNIAITLKDDGKVKMYRNGQEISKESGMKQRMIKKDAQGKLQLGKKYDGADPTFVIQGSLAELYMWDKDLSGDDVTSIFGFKCGSMGDFKSNDLILSWRTIIKPNGLKGKVNKTCPATCPGPSQVCQLDYPRGSQDDYVEAFPNFSRDFEELSLSFWLKVPSSYTNNLAIVSYRTQDESSDMSVVMKDTSEVEFKINGGGKTLSSSFVRDNTWQNIAITLKDDGKVKMYRNGQEISEGTGMKQGNIKKDAQGKLQLGKKYDGADPTFVIQGSLAELYMWDKDLSGGDVTSIFGFKCGSMGDFNSNELILSWGTILQSQGLKGQVKKTCPTTCSG